MLLILYEVSIFLNGNVCLQILAHWVDSYGTHCRCLNPDACCSTGAFVIMPFVDFLKEFYPFVNSDIVMYLIWQHLVYWTWWFLLIHLKLLFYHNMVVRLLTSIFMPICIQLVQKLLYLIGGRLPAD